MTPITDETQTDWTFKILCVLDSVCWNSNIPLDTVQQVITEYEKGSEHLAEWCAKQIAENTGANIPPLNYEKMNNWIEIYITSIKRIRLNQR